MLTTGSCHCGNISFTLDWKSDAPEIPARRCTCSFCTKHGGVWTSCPEGSLRVIVKDPAAVSGYAFGTETARFHVCTRCGVVPLVSCQIGGRLYAVVSVNALEGVDPALVRHPASTTFDGESTEDRLARRQRNWIADVEILPAGA
ncbi:GFA family protein [Cupriavidus sp. 2TAF22]|uniref:GFA family protein n=1 Tax=unclassified Cupriavidus TaxID=2640874 RepID=UPI003F8DD565